MFWRCQICSSSGNWDPPPDFCPHCGQLIASIAAGSVVSTYASPSPAMTSHSASVLGPTSPSSPASATSTSVSWSPAPSSPVSSPLFSSPRSPGPPPPSTSSAYGFSGAGSFVSSADSVVAFWQPPSHPALAPPPSFVHPESTWAPGEALATAQSVMAEHCARNRSKGWATRQFEQTYKGRRPLWSQPVTVWYDRLIVDDSGVDGPLPKFELDENGCMPRPGALMAIVLPSKTTGRGPAEVYGANLAKTGWDKGHLMALSLGGIDERLAIIPQPREANQELEEGYMEEFEVGTNPSWRAMELYVMGLGTLILRRRYRDLRRVLFNNSYKRVWRLKDGVSIATNIEQIHTYAGATVLRSDEPDWVLVYYVEPIYSGAWPGNIAKAVNVDVVACSRDFKVEVLSYTCDWESSKKPLPFKNAGEYADRMDALDQQTKARGKQRREEDKQFVRATAAARMSSLRTRSKKQLDMLMVDDLDDDDLMG